MDDATLEPAEGETAAAHYNRLLNLRAEFLSRVEPLLRASKIEASKDANTREMARRADRDAKRMNRGVGLG